MPAVIQLRSKVRREDAEESFVGRMLTEDDFSVLLTGDAVVYKPNGEKLCALIKGGIPEDVIAAATPALHSLKSWKTDNRATYTASAAKRTRVNSDGTLDRQMRAEKVSSAIVGYYNRTGRHPFCRETAFTAHHVEKWETVVPLAQAVDKLFKRHAPMQHHRQAERAAQCRHEYIIPGTTFSTLTVNNTVRAGCHTDRGDFKPGMGCISAIRIGCWTGHFLVFPEYGVAADLQDGDLLLFDSHAMHGNTPMRALAAGECTCDGDHVDDVVTERISIVYYLREKMIECGPPEMEAERAKAKYGGISET